MNVNELQSKQEAVSPRPIREGLMQMDPPCLLGSRCSDCGTTMFPARGFCPGCASDAAPATVTLANTGVIYSYTVIHQAPPGRKTPYALAYVDLPEGVRVLAQVDAAPAHLAIGVKVILDIRPTGVDAGQTLIGYVFVPQISVKESA
jgi:uncharacterized OB-fold protein